MENDKNSTKDIENNLKNILKQKLESVTVIKGKWGIGKTHFIKNFLDKLLIEDEYKFKYVYVSLFNKNSLDDIEKEITIKLYTTVRAISSVKDKIKNLGLVLGIKADDFNLNTGSIGSIINLGLSIFENKDFENITIVFDDLERLSEKLSFEQVLGFISVLKEDKNCKVIVIMNDDKLGEEKQKIYDTYKEKIVDFEFTYNPTVEENFELIKDRCTCFGDEIKEFFVVNNINNIRNMLQISYAINRICDLNVNKSLLKEAVRYLIPFIYLKKVENKTIKTTIEIFQKYNFYNFTKDLEEEEEELAEDIKRVVNLFSHLKSYDEIFYISFFPDFITPFFKYIDTEILTDNIIREIHFSFEEEIKRRERLEIKNQINEEFKNYIYSVDYKDKDFIEKIWKLFEQYNQDILSIFSISELYNWMVETLSVIDKENANRYKDYFADVIISYLDKTYIEDKEEFKRILKIERFGLRSLKNMAEKVPKLKKYIDTKEKEVESLTLSSCDGLKELILCILKMDCPSTEGEKLNELDFEQIEHCMQNPEFLKILLSFIRHERKILNTNFKNFIEKFDKFLDDFEKKHPEIKEKIEIWRLKTF